MVGDGTPGGTMVAPSTWSKTPHVDDGRTPMYTGGKTPMYGSQTPMYGGSQTPMHESRCSFLGSHLTEFVAGGGRTPHYGTMTPGYESTGSRTPGHTSAWDPNNASTPARGDPDADIHYDEPQSPYNVATPGSMNPQTPGGAFSDTPMGLSFLSR
jgi:transcription elongation factor SPT5